MKKNCLEIKNNCSTDINSHIEFTKNNPNIILQNKNYFEAIQKELLTLKNKENNINSLGELSKELYLTSIPVIIIFTAFIELINTGRFDPLEYLILNGIVTPMSVLINSFVCGTSIGRKNKLANIDLQIKSKEKELSSLCHQISGKKNIVQFKKIDSTNTYKIEPIDHSYENMNIKSLTKKLTR